jgi:hypothetical protein
MYETPELLSVQPLPPETVMAEERFATTAVRVAGVGFGLCTRRITSALDPGRSRVAGVSPARATTVTVCMVPVLLDPVPDPADVKYAQAAPPNAARASAVASVARRDRRLASRRGEATTAASTGGLLAVLVIRSFFTIIGSSSQGVYVTEATSDLSGNG